jgi:hypothetical protein
MPKVHEIVELDMLTLREHTEKAGDVIGPESQRELVEVSLPLSEVASVRRDGMLVAYAMLQPKEDGLWFVTGFNTHPAHRKAPVFKSLFAQISDIASRRNITTLQSNVYRTNRLSLAFHTRLGFHATRESNKGVEFTATVAELLANHGQVVQ